MKRSLLWHALAVGAMVLLAGLSHARAEVTVSRAFGNHMVLQRDLPLPVWGWAAPGEAVAVRLDHAPPVAAKADAQGNWKVVLPAMKADGKAHRLIVSGKNRIELEDILIGEVWLGAGQSNMLVPYNAPEAIAAADHAKVRLFTAPMVQAPAPAKDFNATAAWQVSTPETARSFAGPLYYFGLRLQKELGAPVGLVAAAWGGTRIELWTVQREQSGAMYNSMIAPLVPMAMRGAIWYQGEANTGDGFKYAGKMKALIEGWRGVWGREFPFYFVQLPPFGYHPPVDLPAIWEAQAATLKLPRTGMAVATDLVEDVDEIHGVNKFEVGNRLALWALAKDYGRKGLVYSGPLYEAMKIEGNKIRLSFAHAAGGLKLRDGGPLIDFEIAGADGKFVPAEVTIEGQTVVVSAKAVPAPTQVWFGWHMMCQPNLVNQACLPASPFKTKDWQGGTGE